MTNKIPLAAYARQLGKNPANARQIAARGGFRTAEKLGRDWVVDPAETWPDRRVKSGKYRKEKMEAADE